MRETDLSPQDEYIDALFAADCDPVLPAIRAEACAIGREGMMMSAAECGMLAWLVSLHGGKNIVEIGCFLGSTAICMAHAIKHHAGARVMSCEADAGFAETARGFIEQSNVSHMIEILEGDAHEMLANVSCQPDIVFIDANKAGYADYARWALDVLPVGGLVLADNSLLFGEACKGEYDRASKVSRAAWKNMREMNELLADKARCLGSFIPTPEGLTVAIKK